ncbi:unnamed protein product, partial [marine sediment metagenome]
PYYYVFSANKMVFPGRFTPESFCELVQTEKVTSAGLVPTMLAMLIEFPDLDKYDLSSLAGIAVGGAALPLGLKAKAEKLIPGFTAASGYGMTETAAGSIGAFIKREMKDWPKEKLDEVRENVMCDFCAWQIIARRDYSQFCYILRRFLDEFGRERVMFGTDAPLLEHTISSKRWVEIVRNLPHQSPERYRFTEEEVSALLDGNARRLLASIPQK